MTILNGEIVCEGDSISVKAGQGRYIKRPFFLIRLSNRDTVDSLTDSV